MMMICRDKEAEYTNSNEFKIHYEILTRIKSRVSLYITLKIMS